MMANRSSDGSRMSLGEELERAAEGLYLLSESDYPYEFFTLPKQRVDEFDAQAFLNRIGLSENLLDELGVPLERLIEERPFEGFFPTADDLAERSGLETTDPEVVAESERYRALEALLAERLRDLKVFRVGEVEVRTYIAGLDERGNVAGLMSTSVET
jgi:hypothetical protein